MIASNGRPVCVYALAGFKKNTTKLMVVMCIGIALALYGVYVQARSSSNPNYMPTITLATNWLYNNIGQRIVHPSYLLNGCNGKQLVKQSFGSLMMHRFVYPVTRYSGLFNGFINLVQIVLLKVCYKSLAGVDAIVGLSAAGLAISFVCLIGSFAYCKLMCISCLGIHHVVIIYLAIRRRRILNNILCPTANVNEGSTCTFGSSTGGGGGGAGSGSGGGAGGSGSHPNSIVATSKTVSSSIQTSTKPSTSSGRRSQDHSGPAADQVRRRSGRI